MILSICSIAFFTKQPEAHESIISLAGLTLMRPFTMITPTVIARWIGLAFNQFSSSLLPLTNEVLWSREVRFASTLSRLGWGRARRKNMAALNSSNASSTARVSPLGTLGRYGPTVEQE